MPRVCLVTCCTLGLVWSFGCTPAPPSGPPLAGVKGTVTLDGKPVTTGEVHFELTGAPAKSCEIKDGTFSGEAAVGKNRVEVFIFAEGPASDKYGGLRSKTNTAPQKYWGTNTTLSATVDAGKANEFKFDLTSK